MIASLCPVCGSRPDSGTAIACGDCATHFCSRACRAAGAEAHASQCASIKAAGGIVQREANLKYVAAEAVAGSECEKVEGATCYICLESDGDVVRACACRGDSGHAHVACLVQQARATVEMQGQRGIVRWSNCRLCSQQHHGALRLALGRACWKEYCGRAETDESRAHAMTTLGSALRQVGQYEEALTVFEADLAWIRKFYPHDEANICVSEQNVANTYFYMGRVDEALRRQREAYAKQLRLSGPATQNTLAAAVNLSSSLVATGQHSEAQDLLRDLVPAAEESLGADDRVTLKVRHSYAQALYKDPAASRGHRREAIALLTATLTRSKRVMGREHPFARIVAEELERAKAAAKGGARRRSLPPAIAMLRQAKRASPPPPRRRGVSPRRPGEPPAPRRSHFEKLRRSLRSAVPCVGATY